MYHNPSSRFAVRIEGLMIATVNQLFEGDEDPMTAYSKGYMADVDFGALYYGARAIAAIYEVEVTYTKLNDGTIKISDAWINQ